MFILYHGLSILIYFHRENLHTILSFGCSYDVTYFLHSDADDFLKIFK
jgi:hypothetical protein